MRQSPSVGAVTTSRPAGNKAKALARANSLDFRFSAICDRFLLVGLLALVLSASVLFGGGARQGYRADAVLQLLAVPLLLVALSHQWSDGRNSMWPLAFCVALVFVPLVQLVPLPPYIWTALPLRDLAVRSLSLAEGVVGWRPVSLIPHATWQSLVALVPPISVFLATLLLSWRNRQRVTLLLIGLGLLSSFIGLLQVAAGPEAAPIGFGLGSPGEATGFFANRNHFAALLYCLLLLAAAFVIQSSRSLAARPPRSWETRTLVAIVLSFSVLVALLSGVMMARSRAGVGLTMVALIGISALAASDHRQTATRGTKRLIGAAVALVLIFSSQFALYRVFERFEVDPLEDARLAFARNTWDAAVALMPFGSGLGTFVPVYQFFEKPQDALRDIFANRAHNDVLEIWLETGMMGLVLMTLFAVWLLVGFWRVWRTASAAVPDPGRSPVDLLLMRAASLVIVLLIAHSLVDYPLRTTALSTLFAFSCALLYPPRITDGPALRRTDEAPDVRASQTSQVTIPHEERSHYDRPIQQRTPAPAHQPPDRLESAARQDWNWPASTEQPSPNAIAAGLRSPDDAGPTRDSPDPNASSSKSSTGQRWGVGVDWPAAWRDDKKDKKPVGSD